MNIKPVNLYSFSSQNKRRVPAGNINFLSGKLSYDTFFINMENYEKDKSWAQKITKVCDDITKMVENKEDFEKIMAIAASRTGRINTDKYIEDYMQRVKYDRHYEQTKAMITKFYSDTYGALKGKNSLVCCEISNSLKGKEYLKEYRDTCKKYPGFEFKVQSNDKYPDALTCFIKLLKNGTVRIYYGKENNKNPGYRNILIAKRAYEELINKENPGLNEIMETAATIQWLIAQSTPYNRGSASIANVVTKSLMNAYNIETGPFKKGKSPDYEAFYRNLDDYIKIYPSLFEKMPEFIQTS